MSGRANGKKIDVDNGNMIQKSNDLSLVKMNQGLTLTQMQLLAYSIYATQQGNTTQFIKADFERKFEKNKYTTVRAKDDVKKLMRVQFSFEDMENGEFAFWNVFQSIRYQKGTFSFKWSEDMLPHILDLKEKYVLTDLTVAAQFNSNFSWILYDYLRAKFGHWNVTLSKESLLELFDVEDVSSYQNNTAVFKKTVLNVAIEEINKYTELTVSYDEVKKGRSISGFTLNWSTGVRIKKASKNQMDHLKLMIDVVFEDVLMYMKIEDKTNRERALDIIRDMQKIKLDYLETDVGLTSDKCSELIKSANDDFESLNYLLVAEGKEILKPKVPMHDWLKDYK